MESQNQIIPSGDNGRRNPPGHPDSTAASATTYYGRPMIKRPTWRWYISLYFFIGGLAGGAALIGGLADLLGGERHRSTVRHARWVALAGAILSPPLLIADLGRKGRFHHMLRVLKVSSPMSVGTWLLTAFGVTSGALAAKQAVEDNIIIQRRSRLGSLIRLLPGAPLSMLHALLGLGLGGYTGVLIGITAVPLWFAGGLLLGPLFLATGIASGASLLALLALARGRTRADTEARIEVEQIATIAALAQVSLAAAREVAVPRQVSKPLHSGRWGAIYQVTAVGAGMLGPLALRLPSQVRGGALGRVVSATAATLALVGAVAERFALVEAGKISAADPMAYQETTRGIPGEARPDASSMSRQTGTTVRFKSGQVTPERTGP